MAASTARSPVGAKKREDMNSEFLIAVDFGTTFSAVAYANTLTPDKRSVIKLGERIQGVKAPTVLKYDNGGINGCFKWGFEATQNLRIGERVHEWFKLGLCPKTKGTRTTGTEFQERFPSMTALPPVNEEQCKKLVTDYLASLRYYMDEHLKKTFQENSRIPRKYILTVPAMWTNKAKKATRDCAADAGMGYRPGELKIIAEPEAAGIYALATMSRPLKVGDTFVICDAGGGTVDLSSYHVKSLKPFIDLGCTSIPSGGLYGSSFLNRIFLDYVQKKLRGHSSVVKSPQGYQKWLKMEVNEHFENKIKPLFTGEEEAGYMYHIPAFGFIDSLAHGIQGEELNVPAKDIREKVFDLVTNKIQGLVQDHIAATGEVKAILLAGGFGLNKYLEKQVKKIAGPRIQVDSIENSSTAIVRGALMAGLADVEQQRLEEQQGEKSGQNQQGAVEDRGTINVRVTSWLAPKHYGVSVWEAFNPKNEIHAKRERPSKDIDGRQSIEVMKWFVRKNEVIQKSKPIQILYSKEVSNNSVPCEIKCDIYTFQDGIPPDYPHTNKYPNPAIKIPHVTVKMDLEDTSELPTETLNGRTYYNVPFMLDMTLDSGDPTFYLFREKGDKIKGGCKTYASKSVSFHG
ncbi:hypothetical protein BJ875DRAFT_489111 [Amylocarpus encephaloides]|uniref:Uncharacterized protein n=1 Tax=Amylocarpus encephaloides TaxID=45428 RepID=A0A9P7Y9R0_9HELO|nr:hypothetical protein BJ875DRAFT_489111 [Amylocarpus encephaloides]